MSSEERVSRDQSVQDFTDPVSTLGFVLFAAGRCWSVLSRNMLGSGLCVLHREDGEQAGEAVAGGCGRPGRVVAASEMERSSWVWRRHP